MPPEERFVPASPPSLARGLPYGRWAERLSAGVPRGPAWRSTPRRPTWASPARSAGTSTARGTGGHTCRVTSITANGYELFGHVSFVGAVEGGDPSDFTAQVDFTEETAERNPDWELDLCDEVIRVLARCTTGRSPRWTLSGGRPLSPAGRSSPRGWRSRPVDQCEPAGGALHADRARRLSPPNCSRSSCSRPGGRSSRGSRCMRETVEDQVEEDTDSTSGEGDGGRRPRRGIEPEPDVTTQPSVRRRGGGMTAEHHGPVKTQNQSGKAPAPQSIGESKRRWARSTASTQRFAVLIHTWSARCGARICFAPDRPDRSRSRS